MNMFIQQLLSYLKYLNFFNVLKAADVIQKNTELFNCSNNIMMLKIQSPLRPGGSPGGSSSASLCPNEPNQKSIVTTGKYYCYII